MYLVQSKPKFADEEITEAMFVVSSFSLSTPPPTGCFLIAIYVTGIGIIRVDCVDTADYADSLTQFVQLSTVLG